MISLFKNLVSSENDAKKYHLRSYYEMLEIAFDKDYELNPNFLKSIQQEFNISEHEHEVIMETIMESNENLSLNIINLLQNMEDISAISNKVYDDSTAEIFFVKKILQDEFNKLSDELFKLLEKMYTGHEVEFDGCKRLFKYSENQLIGVSPQIYDFMSSTIVSHLQNIHSELNNTNTAHEDNNLDNLLKLLSYNNRYINISALVAIKNYELESKDILKKYIVDADDDIQSLANKIIRQSDEITDYEKMAYLSKVPLFASLSFEELQSLAKKSDIVEYKNGEEIISLGEKANNLYILLSGEVEVTKDSQKLNELSSGDFFGEIAIVAKSKRIATVKALSDINTLVFSEVAFNEIINKYPNISVEIMKEMTKRLLQNNA